MIFQDGDKRQYTPMLERLVELLRPGGLLVTDNVLWSGDVVPGLARPEHQNAPDAMAIADYNQRLSRHPRLMTVHRAAPGRGGDLNQETHDQTTQ